MASKKETVKQNTKKNEIAGVIFIALAVLCAVAIYFNISSWFGDGIKSVVFGLFGIAGYVFPIVAGVIGVLFIVNRQKKPGSGRVLLVIILVILILSLLHLSIVETVTTDNFADYMAESYTVGSSDAAGGGAIGCLLVYPCYLLMGMVGSYIVFFAAIAVCIIAFTRFSLKKAGSDIGNAVKTGYENIVEYREEKRQIREQGRQALFIEDLNATKDSDMKEFRDNPYDIKIEAGKNSISVGKIYKGQKKTCPEPKPEEPEPKEEVSEIKYVGTFAKEDEAFVDDTVDLLIQGRQASEQVRKIKAESKSKKSESDSPRKLSVKDSSSGRRKLTDKKSPESGVLPKKSAGKTSGYLYPPTSLLKDGEEAAAVSARDKKQNAVLLEDTLHNFGISATVESISVGPVVTRYEVKPAAGIKVSRIVNLADDIALAFAVAGVRIEAPIPGKAAVGIEVPNSSRSGVCLKDLLCAPEYNKIKNPTVFALGKDIAGKNIYADIAKLPHLLIAGETGAGKSVCENSLICSILFNASPKEVRMIMIDPKMVELSEYNNIPHLLIPVVTDIKKAPAALQWAVNEMTMRYRMLSANGVRDIYGYNSRLEKDKDPLPQLLIIIDEVAELMMASGKEVEDSICRLAQLGRAAGIHIVVATQRPSVNVITGVIKANIPSRIAFSVSSQTDSRVILDQPGAEKLLGRGDMLFMPTGAPKPFRVQGCFVSDYEVKALCDFLRENFDPMYDKKVEEDISNAKKDSTADISEDDDQTDPLFADAVKLVVDAEQASTSMLQRRFRIGYARAGRLIDEMELRGYVSGYDGSKPRSVLISRDQYEEIFGQDTPEV